MTHCSLEASTTDITAQEARGKRMTTYIQLSPIVERPSHLLPSSGECSLITVLILKEEPQGHIQQLPRLGVPLGSTVQPCQIISDTTIGRLNHMRLRFAYHMGCWHALLGTCDGVTTVRIRTDTGNGRDERFDFSV